MAKYCYSTAVLLLMVVVTAQGQISGPDRPTTGVRLYLQEVGSNDEFAISNFTVLNAGFFTDEQNDILWCQSANNGNPIGDWYFPAGGQVDVIDDAGPFHVLHVDGQIGLLRNLGVLGLEGLYNCVIPDENNITQTLWVGIYRTGTYTDAAKNFIIDDPMEFSLVSSSSDTDPPVFTLSFNVTNVPPTTVECYVDNTTIDIEYVDRLVIMAEDPVRVLVTVTINSRQSGSYHCSVMADSAGGTSTLTDPLDITVTDIPTNVTITRPGFQQAIINWSPPISNTPIVQGYDVYYESPNGTRLSNNVGNSTMTTLDNLDPELYYSVFVVALGGDLPSPASSMINITEAPSLSYAAINISITVTNTTATITFIIPAIAYTPEQYHIEYIGLELQNVLTNSTTVIMGPDNITATDIEYSITLTGLEEDNTYNISVVSTNCEGSTKTSDVTLTTLPGAPTGTIQNCTDTTFSPREVSLSWDPLVLELQNGVITSYQLICFEDSSVMSIIINKTISSSNTFYTIMDLTPFQIYNCSISAINSEGIGPSEYCVFKTAQDVPSDTPQNFHSVINRLQIVFTWSAPKYPNGIITHYQLTVSIASVTVENGYDITSYLIIATEEPTYTRIIYGLIPYQQYSATVAARTIVGYGPVSLTSGRTDPDISSAIIPWTVPFRIIEETIINTFPAIDSDTLNITWQSPASPNGYINHYNIDVSNRRNDSIQYPFYNFIVSAIDGQECYNLSVSDLVAGVPYYITIGAVNEIGQGENITIIGFSAVKTTMSVPTNITTSRSSNGTVLTVNWYPVSLEDAGGFYKYNLILSAIDRSIKIVQFTQQIPYNHSSTIFVRLLPSTRYSLQMNIIVINTNGEEISEPLSQPLEINVPSSSTNLAAILVPTFLIIFIIILVICIVVLLIYTVIRKHRLRKSCNLKADKTTFPSKESKIELTQSPAHRSSIHIQPQHDDCDSVIIPTPVTDTDQHVYDYIQAPNAEHTDHEYENCNNN